MANLTYREQENIANIVKLREILSEFPPYMKDYFRGREATQSTRTQLSYAYDFKVFFQFLCDMNPLMKGLAYADCSLDILESLKAIDIEEYMEYLKYYQHPTDDKGITNTNRGIARKIASLRSLYAYLYKHEMIKNNPTLLVELPKLHDKTIIKLDPDEIAILLDYMEACGNDLNQHQKKYYAKTVKRDLAIVTLLLGTGMRLSECVGLDITDLDFKNNGVRLMRKGGNEMVVYFGAEVEVALLNYLEERELIQPQSGHENALFLSLQKKRISPDALENVVKKYSSAAIPGKKITAHKLRSTYGTALYNETGDIYLVADVLGHCDVNTTRKHYANLDDNRRRKAANAVTLR